jgi:hypothetical protein
LKIRIERPRPRRGVGQTTAAEEHDHDDEYEQQVRRLPEKAHGGVLSSRDPA